MGPARHARVMNTTLLVITAGSLLLTALRLVRRSLVLVAVLAVAAVVAGPQMLTWAHSAWAAMAAAG